MLETNALQNYYNTQSTPIIQTNNKINAEFRHWKAPAQFSNDKTVYRPQDGYNFWKLPVILSFKQ